ncbi:MAG TPA: PilZ domain-containing protein, partial [Thiomicrospira sp.]|nr:PilZ domain-containing protein [Thiomicrospira sp.]
MDKTKISEFDFSEEGSQLSKDEADIQKASMAFHLAVSQLKSSGPWGALLLSDIEETLQSAMNQTIEVTEVEKLFKQFINYYQH